MDTIRISNCMDTKWEIRAALILILILIMLGLQACGQVPVVDKIIEQEETKHAVEDQQTGGAPNFQGIADALGCVFAPQSCKK